MIEETGVKQSDEFYEIHEAFFEMYDGGLTARETALRIREEYAQEFADANAPGDHILLHEVCFALAYCLWECGERDDALWQQVRGIIESGANLPYWLEPAGDEAAMRSRDRALRRFLKTISTPKARPRMPRKRREPRPLTLHKGDLFAYACEGGFRAALTLDFLDDQFLIAIAEPLFPTLPPADEVMSAQSRTVAWFPVRACIPRKDRHILATLPVTASYNNRAGFLYLPESIIICCSFGERAYFLAPHEADGEMQRNHIGRYPLQSLLDPSVLPLLDPDWPAGT